MTFFRAAPKKSLMKSTKTPEISPQLRDIGVLVTRPAHQAEGLCHLIEQQGGTSIRFPVIEIIDIEDDQHLSPLIKRLDEFDIAIFISPNAVNKAITRIRSSRNWPNTIKIAAVGKSSAKALDSLGLIVDIFPSLSYNSEALLELEPMLNVAGKNIIIFRGVGGREHLAETLISRGANVEYAECYQRIRPQNDASEIIKRGVSGEIKIIICTSNEGLQNLYDMVGPSGRQWLINTPIVVVSERAAELARQLGFNSDVLISERANDDAILNSILLWRSMKEA